jgi:cell division transport system permease protein
MSPDSAIARRFSAGGEDRSSQRQGLLARLRAEPLLPEAGAAGAPLTAAIGVMSFLAALALAGLLLIFAASNEWTSELRRGITIQIKGADAAEIEAGAEAAMRIVQSTDGVMEARLLSREETARLLEPWLGKGNVAEYLNVPALIEARVSETLRQDLAPFEKAVKAAAPGAVLDDHKQWRERLTTAARTGQALAAGAFALIMCAAAAIAAFAARAGLAANSEVVSILHLVGATDSFIANEVQRRFLVLALRGSLVGLFLAAVAVGLSQLGFRAAEGAGYFLPELQLGPGVISVLLVVPLALCFVTAVTARMTVLKTLSKEM